MMMSSEIPGVFFLNKTPLKLANLFDSKDPETVAKDTFLGRLAEQNHPRKSEVFRKIWLFEYLREANPPLREAVAIQTFPYREIAVRRYSKCHIFRKTSNFRGWLGSAKRPKNLSSATVSGSFESNKLANFRGVFFKKNTPDFFGNVFFALDSKKMRRKKI